MTLEQEPEGRDQLGVLEEHTKWLDRGVWWGEEKRTPIWEVGGAGWWHALLGKVSGLEVFEAGQEWRL